MILKFSISICHNISLKYFEFNCKKKYFIASKNRPIALEVKKDLKENFIGFFILLNKFIFNDSKLSNCFYVLNKNNNNLI